MTREEARKLLAGYATSSLSEREQQQLFAAALEDQDLFDELAEEQGLKELIELPGARARLIAALEPAGSKQRVWWPWAALAAGMAALTVWVLIPGGETPQSVAENNTKPQQVREEPAAPQSPTSTSREDFADLQKATQAEPAPTAPAPSALTPSAPTPSTPTPSTPTPSTPTGEDRRTRSSLKNFEPQGVVGQDLKQELKKEGIQTAAVDPKRDAPAPPPLPPPPPPPPPPAPVPTLPAPAKPVQPQAADEAQAQAAANQDPAFVRGLGERFSGTSLPGGIGVGGLPPAADAEQQREGAALAERAQADRAKAASALADAAAKSNAMSNAKSDALTENALRTNDPQVGAQQLKEEPTTVAGIDPGIAGAAKGGPGGGKGGGAKGGAGGGKGGAKGAPGGAPAGGAAGGGGRGGAAAGGRGGGGAGGFGAAKGGAAAAPVAPPPVATAKAGVVAPFTQEFLTNGRLRIVPSVAGTLLVKAGEAELFASNPVVAGTAIELPVPEGAQEVRIEHRVGDGEPVVVTLPVPQR